MTKKMNIAFTGAFDIANYGDHLFPLVFGKELDNYGIEYNLFLFSVFNSKQAFNSNNTVYSLEDIEQLHEQFRFDAIIVGGGELIHFNSCMQLLNNNSEDFVNYKIFETWTVPSYMGIKYNIPIIWNSPGGQYKFPDSCNPLVKLLCRPVKYLSVRNYTTKANLISCGIDKDLIFHIPDTAFKISDYYTKEYLSHILKSILPINKPYIVYHVNRHISQDDLLCISDLLMKYKDKGFDIVLLPLAYTHNDQQILLKLNELANKSFISFNEMLSLEETISILAYCKLYVGISFHGAVTSISYNNPAIIYDYIGSEKSKDLFELVERPDCYITDINKLDSKINEMITSVSSYPIDNIKEKINNHFSNVFKFITSDSLSCKEDIKMFSEFIERNTKELFDNKFTCENDIIILNDAKQYITQLEDELVDAKKYINILEQELVDARKHIYILEQANNKMQNDIEFLQLNPFKKFIKRFYKK